MAGCCGLAVASFSEPHGQHADMHASGMSCSAACTLLQMQALMQAAQTAGSTHVLLSHIGRAVAGQHGAPARPAAAPGAQSKDQG